MCKKLKTAWPSTRCTVERTFGILKQHDGMAKVRYLASIRNAMRGWLDVA